MRTVPRKRLPQIDYFTAHVTKWTQEAEALDLDAEQIARLQAKVDTARQALGAQQIAQAQARAKTDALHAALEDMNAEGASIISQIRNKAFTLGPSAYILGNLPVPEKGSPIAPPGRAHSFTAELTQLGTLILRWKCKNPRNARGTTYQVSRQLDGGGGGGGGGGEMEILGLAGRKQYEDATLPPGVKTALYRVQAFRSTTAGPIATHSISFGFNAHGLPVPGNMQLAA